jgi:hypothetical protein
VRRLRAAAGRWLPRAAMVLLLWLLGGLAGLLLGVVIVVLELRRPLAPRRLLLSALLLLLALPLVVLARGLPTRATLSPDFAAASLLPHLLAGAALTLLVLGVLRDVRANLPPEPPEPPEPAPPDAGHQQRALASRGAAGELEPGGALERARDPGARDGHTPR